MKITAGLPPLAARVRYLVIAGHVSARPKGAGATLRLPALAYSSTVMDGGGDMGAKLSHSLPLDWIYVPKEASP